MQNIFAIELVWIGLAKYATKILASIIYHNIAMGDYPTLFHSLSAQRQYYLRLRLHMKK